MRRIASMCLSRTGMIRAAPSTLAVSAVLAVVINT
jgi:hypothetical protein